MSKSQTQTRLKKEHTARTAFCNDYTGDSSPVYCRCERLFTISASVTSFSFVQLSSLNPHSPGLPLSLQVFSVYQPAVLCYDIGKLAVSMQQTVSMIRILSTYRAAFNRDGQSKHHQCGCSFIYVHLNIKPL